jgi:hypothetical protein
MEVGILVYQDEAFQAEDFLFIFGLSLGEV